MHELEDQLRALVERHGPAEVRKQLTRITSSPKRSVRKTAIQYVTEMSVPAIHKERLLSLARRFEEGNFLPNAADIRNLFEEFGAKPREVKARQAAVPMVFKFLASCPTDRLDKILSHGLFSGPAELAPIAQAIRSKGAGE